MNKLMIIEKQLVVKKRLQEIADIEVGDIVLWGQHPSIKSKVVKIAPSKFCPDVMLYHCRNGCQFQRHEIMLYKLGELVE